MLFNSLTFAVFLPIVYFSDDVRWPESRLRRMTKANPAQVALAQALDQLITERLGAER